MLNYPNDSALKDVVSQFSKEAGDIKREPISRNGLNIWMQSEDIEVLGAVYRLIMDKSCYKRIQPPLNVHEYVAFVKHYYGRCFRENPESEWADSRYSAGWGLVAWFNHLWRDSNVSRKILAEIKRWIADLYKGGTEEIRKCIITATLEHLFEDKTIAKYFIDWRKDSELGSAYEEALGYSKHFQKHA